MGQEEFFSPIKSSVDSIENSVNILKNTDVANLNTNVLSNKSILDSLVTGTKFENYKPLSVANNFGVSIQPNTVDYELVSVSGKGYIDYVSVNGVNSVNFKTKIEIDGVVVQEWNSIAHLGKVSELMGIYHSTEGSRTHSMLLSNDFPYETTRREVKNVYGYGEDVGTYNDVFIPIHNMIKFDNTFRLLVTSTETSATKTIYPLVLGGVE